MSEELSDIIVGNGIAAHAFLWTYARKLKMGHLDQARRLIWIKSPIVPTCSLTSTSIVSRAGLQYGVSPLGDELLRSYEIFEQYFGAYAGVSKAVQTHLPYGDLDNFNKRYGEAAGSCFVIASDQFLKQLRKDIASSLSSLLTIIEGTVLQVEQESLVMQDGSSLLFNQCYLCLGAGNVFVTKLERCRSVAGQFAWSEANLGQHSWVRSYGPYNLIYRALDQKLLVGSLDDKEDSLGWPVMAARPSQLKEILSHFKVELPEKLSWTVESGVRHKGPKRRPHWGKISDNVWSTHGLYKNGYSLSFLAADELTKGMAPSIISQ